MKLDKCGGTAKLAILGLGAMFMYRQFGGLGLIIMGVIILLLN